MCEFIIISNAIERYHVPVEETLQAVKSFLHGLPVEYCTENKYIRSHLSGLDTAASLMPVNTPKKIQIVHESMGNDVLERGLPGVFRNFEHYARNGYKFSEPSNILSDLNLFCQTEFKTPFDKHVEYECIHPFSDGNGRSGRILMCADMGFDFNKINKLLDNSYIQRIIKIQNNRR